ncbi:MAG TPA: hypothetical protein VMG10_09590 [Gemmataceae bacterium]|nr:hypothetical protein [Gemmataceae bacterium]
MNGDSTLDGPSQTVPALYQMPSTNFHDITSGSNGTYSAGPGYDLVTGLGSPIANLVVNSLVSYDASYWQNVDLSSYYNRNGLTWGGTQITGGGIDGNNDALEGYTSINWQGNSIPLGPVNALDAVSAQGQTITLPAGQYSTLTIFATAVNSGNQTNQNFTVNYSDYTSQTFTRSLTNWLTSPGYSDEVRVMQTHAFNPDGSQMSSPAYVSAYALPLDPAKTVQSITLPNDSNIVILAIGLYHDSATAQTADVSSYYNRNGLTWGGTQITGGGIDGNNDALEGYASVNWQGNSIPLGPVNALDVVSAQGQTITLPAGQYSTLTIFATAVNSGNQTNQNFTVNYSDYTSQTFTRSLTNWLTSPGYSDEVRLMQTHAFNPDGSQMSSPAYVSAYALPLDPAKTVQSITLPNDSNIVILAIEVT